MWLEAQLQSGAARSQLRYSARDAALYALAAGFGWEPGWPAEADYVQAAGGLRLCPAFAALLGWCRLPDAFQDAGSPLMPRWMRLNFTRRLLPAGELVTRTRVTAEGERPGTPMHGCTVTVDARLPEHDDAVFDFHVRLTDGEGGDVERPSGQKRPAGRPAFSTELQSTPQQAVLFDLARDPDSMSSVTTLMPTAAGQYYLPPICTLGIACRALLRSICDYDATLITALEVGVESLLLAGDGLVTDCWQQGHLVYFDCRSRSSGERVLADGCCELVS